MKSPILDVDVADGRDPGRRRVGRGRGSRWCVRARRRSEEVDEVEAAVREALDFVACAPGAERADVDDLADEVEERTGQRQFRYVDQRLLALRRADLKGADLDGEIGDLGDGEPVGEFSPVMGVEVECAIVDREADEVVVVRRVFLESDALDGEFPAGPDRAEIEDAAPREFFSRFRDGGEAVRILVVGAGAEIVQRDIDRADRGVERRGSCEIVVHELGAGNLQLADAEGQRFAGRFLRRRRLAGKPFKNVGEIETAIPVRLHVGERVADRNLLHRELAPEGRGQGDVHVDFVPGEKRFAARLAHEQSVNGDRQGVGIQFDPGDRDLPAKLFRQLPEQ